MKKRQREILCLVAVGMTDKEIAQRLHLAHSTVKSYLTALYAQYRLQNRAQAAVWALQQGYLSDVVPVGHEKMPVESTLGAGPTQLDSGV